MTVIEVFGVRVDPLTAKPVVLLVEHHGDRFLPVWVGPNEATAIAATLDGLKPVRPMTHDLLIDIIAALGDELLAVRIVDHSDGVFGAELVFSSGAVVRARASDAIALAVRTGCALTCEESVLAEASVVLPLDQLYDDDARVAQFRQFLNDLEPSDFGDDGTGEPG